MEKRIIETIGHVEKKETLQSLGYSDLVLESQHPFPGYHGTTVPDKVNPKSLFLLTRTRYTEEFIIRSVKSVKRKHKFEFDGSPARVFFQNTMAHAIRVKDLKSYKLIPEIIDAFKDEGIAFLPGKKVKPYYGLIRVTKYFLMDPITDCTLQDSEIDSMKYFQVPIKLEWDEFEEMTKHVKRNINDSNWDGALATIYRKTGIEDHIRIFCEKDSSLEKLNEIRKKYVQEIKKIMGK